MKRKKRAGMAKSGWIVLHLCLLWMWFAVAGGHFVRKKHVKDPRAEAQLGDPQWTVESPLFQHIGRKGRPLPAVARHLLSATNETTAAPPEKDKTIWEEIEDFYADDNNMAMYCVLPLIILVYGGCSAIYCVYKCRRYLRRRGKHKRLRNEDTGSVSGDERNDLNQVDEEGRPVKTISGTTWDDSNAAFTDVGYNVQRKKTPLPWDSPQKTNNQSRDANYSAGSRDSTSMALEQEREKLDRTKPPPLEASTMKSAPPPRPIQIVPISQKEYQRHMEANGGLWDPLHNRPFDSRASGLDRERSSRQGRESSWSIRDEIMAKYDALTSLAMAKKTADVLRSGAQDPNMDMGHRPDTLKRKPGKKKLIFIAE